VHEYPARGRAGTLWRSENGRSKGGRGKKTGHCGQREKKTKEDRRTSVWASPTRKPSLKNRNRCQVHQNKKIHVPLYNTSSQSHARLRGKQRKAKTLAPVKRRAENPGGKDTRNFKREVLCQPLFGYYGETRKVRSRKQPPRSGRNEVGNKVLEGD